MKVKAIKSIDSSCSYHGLSYDNWARLNAGRKIELDSIPKQLEDYVEVIKPKKPKKEEVKYDKSS